VSNKWSNSDKAVSYNSDTGELRDIFAALAMHALLADNNVTPKWVATNAYKYADAMLDVRDEGEKK